MGASWNTGQRLEEFMYRVTSSIIGYGLHAEDGTIGKVKDLLFDDEHWTIRYVVADSGQWLPGRKVLLSPASVRSPDWESRTLDVHLTKKQIQEAPGLDEHAPVSRQFERQLNEYYAIPHYWGGLYTWGGGAAPMDLYNTSVRAQPVEPTPSELPDEEESRLRSVHEVTGYHIEAEDGEIGHLDDFIMDDVSWTIRYLVIKTRNWLPGRRVLLAPDWARNINWYDADIAFRLTREQIRNSPEFDPQQPVNRAYEETLYNYYGQPVYWDQ
jgi:hypothetical protein